MTDYVILQGLSMNCTKFECSFTENIFKKFSPAHCIPFNYGNLTNSLELYKVAQGLSL